VVKVWFVLFKHSNIYFHPIHLNSFSCSLFHSMLPQYCLWGMAIVWGSCLGLGGGLVNGWESTVLG